MKASDIQSIAFVAADGIAFFIPASAPAILLAEKLLLELEKSGAIKLEPSAEEIAKWAMVRERELAAGEAAKASSDATSKIIAHHSV